MVSQMVPFLQILYPKARCLCPTITGWPRSQGVHSTGLSWAALKQYVWGDECKIWNLHLTLECEDLHCSILFMTRSKGALKTFEDAFEMPDFKRWFKKNARSEFWGRDLDLSLKLGDRGDRGDRFHWFKFGSSLVQVWFKFQSDTARLFKQAHVSAGIDFKKYDDIEVCFPLHQKQFIGIHGDRAHEGKERKGKEGNIEPLLPFKRRLAQQKQPPSNNWQGNQTKEGTSYNNQGAMATIKTKKEQPPKKTWSTSKPMERTARNSPKWRMYRQSGATICRQSGATWCNHADQQSTRAPICAKTFPESSTERTQQNKTNCSANDLSFKLRQILWIQIYFSEFHSDSSKLLMS